MFSPSVKRIGHKGADAIVAGNTTASFDAALKAGVEMIEFDVLPDRQTGQLKLAHDYKDLQARPDALLLEKALEHLATSAFSSIEFNVDLKLPGYEAAVASLLQRYELTTRSLISCMNRSVLLALRSLEPELRLGWSVPRVSRDYTQMPLFALPALVFLSVARRTLPKRAARALAAGECDAIMANWRLVTPQLVSAVETHNGELYVWTVDDAREIERLTALGVTGVITNDPRLFDQLTVQSDSE